MIAIEPNGMHKFMSKKIDFRRGYFPAVMQNSEQVDFAYAGIIDYCFSDEEYIKFLRDIYCFGIKQFMLVNCMSGRTNESFKQHFKEIAKELLSRLKLRSRGQFWGYLRSLEEQILLLQKAGFSDFEVGSHAQNNGFWVLAKP